MGIMNSLMILQEKYDAIEEYNRILKNGSHIYLLKKLKSDFEKTKEDFMERENKLKALKQQFITLGNTINCEKKELEKNEGEFFNLRSSAYKIAEHMKNKIESRKQRLKQLEDASLQLLEEEDRINTEKEELRIQLVNLKENFYKHKASINRDIVAAHDNLNKAKREVEQLSKTLPSEVIEKFNKTIKKKGTAIVRLEGGMCSACRMRVSALTMDNVYKGMELINCDNCGRFLYFNLEEHKLAK